MKIGALEFRSIDLEKHWDMCLKFREDSFVVSFGSAAAFYESDGKGAERYLEWLKQRMSEIPDSCVHVWDGERIVGQMEMRRSKDDTQAGYVNLFYLIPEYRGKGVASLLDEYAAMFFEQLGCKVARLSVSPTNVAAVKFYLKHGWKDLGVREGHAEVHLMEKQYAS
jgi:ribosomal protein S18 acetylase RimI-like enzyme